MVDRHTFGWMGGWMDGERSLGLWVNVSQCRNQTRPRTAVGAPTHTWRWGTRAGNNTKLKKQSHHRTLHRGRGCHCHDDGSPACLATTAVVVSAAEEGKKELKFPS